MNHPAVSSAPFHTVIHIGILAADILFVGVKNYSEPSNFLRKKLCFHDGPQEIIN
jgi:hypothetical protein